MAFAIPVTLTSFHPIDSGVEGGPTDCKGRKLITLEQHLADPVTYPYAALAGDCTVWPDGQRVILPDLNPNAIFRIVDTGGSFTGSGKVIRYEGHEPLDVCVNVGNSFLTPSTAIIVAGDDWGTQLCWPSSFCPVPWDGTYHLPDYLVATPVDPGVVTGAGGFGPFAIMVAYTGLVMTGVALAMR